MKKIIRNFLFRFSQRQWLNTASTRNHWLSVERLRPPYVPGGFVEKQNENRN